MATSILGVSVILYSRVKVVRKVILADFLLSRKVLDTFIDVHTFTSLVDFCCCLSLIPHLAHVDILSTYKKAFH